MRRQLPKQGCDCVSSRVPGRAGSHAGGINTRPIKLAELTARCTIATLVSRSMRVHKRLWGRLRHGERNRESHRKRSGSGASHCWLGPAPDSAG